MIYGDSVFFLYYFLPCFLLRESFFAVFTGLSCRFWSFAISSKRRRGSSTGEDQDETLEME